MEEKLIGKITHYYGKINVAIVEIMGPLSVNDQIHVKGHTTDFNQVVSSMQVEHENVPKAQKGDLIGLKLEQPVKEGDEIYLLKD
ncbi:MAG: translation elongation factor-like protein [Minisyncoccia bacterium]